MSQLQHSDAPPLALYAAQFEGVSRFRASEDKRLVLAYATGCGKTPTAIRCLGEAHRRILVVCPAIVRRHWVGEFRRWAGLEAHAIEMGRERISGTKAQLAARDAAYDAIIQVVSYDLLAQVDQGQWDAIVFDEIHHLSDCQSRQSRAAQAIVRQNPDAAMLGLSATLIPTVLWQLWHPMHLLFGDAWGKPPRAGSIPWKFVGKYCEVVKNEWGSMPGAPIAEKMPELQRRLAKVCHRLTREDIAADLPPIDCHVLEVPGNVLNRSVRSVNTPAPEIAIAVEWFKSLPQDIHRVVVLTYHRALAEAIAQALGPYAATGAPSFVIDGSMPTAKRVEMLAACEAAKRCVLVATSESIREGVRLMWADKVLFAEWRQSPAQVVQVLGRFQSVGDSRRPQVEILTDESLYGQASKLLERVGAINALLKAGGAERVVEEVFAPKEMSAERLEELTRKMLSEAPRMLDADWHEDTESEDEDGW